MSSSPGAKYETITVRGEGAVGFAELVSTPAAQGRLRAPMKVASKPEPLNSISHGCSTICPTTDRRTPRCPSICRAYCTPSSPR
jgi:hypothetical protein